MKVGDLVQEDTKEDIGIVIGCSEGTTSILVFSLSHSREQFWSPYHTEVISESRRPGLLQWS